MNKPVSLALLVVGIVLLIFGFNASESASSEISRAFTGNPTDRTMWFFVGGAVATILGLFGLLRGGGRSNPM
jgi:hypothetical protein